MQTFVNRHGLLANVKNQGNRHSNNGNHHQKLSTIDESVRGIGDETGTPWVTSLLLIIAEAKISLFASAAFSVPGYLLVATSVECVETESIWRLD